MKVKPSLIFSASVSSLVATLVTTFVTVWEWLENPGGIFHDAAGTRWHFVFDTAISWFVPVLLQTFMIALLGHLAFAWWVSRSKRE
ncbi:MAG: hypothetical protein ACFHX7_25345 [Pseudomonadota bacterium]